MAQEIGRGLYETMHGSPGSRGADTFGRDRMVLCDDCAESAWEIVSTYWNADHVLKADRPFKIELWNPIRAGYACESCGS